MSSSTRTTTQPGITGVTHGGCLVPAPSHVPDGEYWRYGVGFPFQLSATRAGIFANIHRVSAHTWDYEAGTDCLLFDDLRTLVAGVRRPDFPQPSRSASASPARIVVMVKYPDHGGFVPLRRQTRRRLAAPACRYGVRHLR